jgi:hypothetical protein
MVSARSFNVTEENYWFEAAHYARLTLAQVIGSPGKQAVLRCVIVEPLAAVARRNTVE